MGVWEGEDWVAVHIKEKLKEMSSEGVYGIGIANKSFGQAT